MMALFKHKWCISGGKDSSAMIIRAKEIGMKIDEILFADTGNEFPEVYDYLFRLEDFLGMEITRLKPKTTWDDWFFGKATRGKHKGKMRGWPMVVYGCWWHREAKFKVLDRACKPDMRYIGIAFDETKRLRVKPLYHYPLAEWGWKESDCLDYLKKKGMAADIHTKFKRTGCYLCPKQSKKSLLTLCRCYPKLWKKMMAYNEIKPFPNFNLKKIELESKVGDILI